MSNPDLDNIQESAVFPNDENYPPLKAEADNLDKEKAYEDLKTLALKNQITQEELKRKQEELKRFKSENNQRIFVQQNVWDLMKAWLACVLLLTLFSGLERGIPLCQRTGAELSCQTLVLHYEKEVLIALISSPTVAIIGLSVIVLKYLFPNKDEN
jgi:hypothetical protein